MLVVGEHPTFYLNTMLDAAAYVADVGKECGFKVPQPSARASEPAVAQLGTAAVASSGASVRGRQNLRLPMRKQQ